jgi:CheY-like chemotaxis protein
VSKRKLLLADDSITIQKVVNLTFADEGIEVTSVGDGDSAMQKFDEFMPDLVMADVNMPGLNGYEICQIIKQNEETRHIPVILLVGSFEPFDEAEATRVGADDHLTKPFQSIRQLVNKVTDLLNRQESVAEETQSEPENAPAVDNFADTLELEEKSEIPNEFGDAGMDDEMIETSPAHSFDSEPNQIFPTETTTDSSKTQSLSAEDWKGFDIVTNDEDDAQAFKETAQTDETVEEKPEEIEAAEMPETEMPVEESNVVDSESSEESESEPEKASYSEPDYYSPADDENLRAEPENLETPETEITESETAELQTAETEITEDEPPHSFDESKFEDLPETETPVEDKPEIEEPKESPADLMEESHEESAETETVKVEDVKTAEFKVEQADLSETEPPISSPQNVSALSFDDGDLLELPPLVEETGIRPQAFVQETKPEVLPESEPEIEAITEPVPPTETQTEPETTVEAAQIQSFPPELIEAIAQKVAERISDKAIRDIAWEVVPQITELIIKKMAEEKMKE